MPTIDVLLAGMTVNTDQTRLGLATIALIRGRANILVDVGHYGRRALLEEALAQRNLSPDDIPYVVITHSHWDHAQNVDVFPNATFLIHPKELEYARAPRKGDWATPSYFNATLQGLRVKEAVEGTEIEPGVKIIETPGHTRGHISVVVDTPQGAAIVAADAFPDAHTVSRGQPYLIFWSDREAKASVRKMLGLANIIYPGHDRPFRIAGQATHYFGGATSIRVSAAFERGDSGVGVTISVEGVHQPWSHPEARDS
ncbi:MAG: MBL fold metallo-hydrolase [Chloroflexi bacterium]|nr:MBL fold metallo-hydrolase [Chloroflexota bacterium]